jgi:hypothetical protein
VLLIIALSTSVFADSITIKTTVSPKKAELLAHQEMLQWPTVRTCSSP